MDLNVVLQHVIPYHFLSVTVKLRSGDFIPIIQSNKIIICYARKSISADIHKEFDALNGGYCPQDGAPRVVGWYAKYELGPPPIPMTAHGKDLVNHVLRNHGAEGRIKLYLLHFGFAGLVK